MDILHFGQALLWIAAGVLGLLVALCVLGVALKSRRCVRATRYGLYAVFVLVLGASSCLVTGFLTGQYNNEYIFNYSEKDLDPFFKFAGLWAGLDGSLLFWTLILAGGTAVCALQHEWSSRHPSGRRMEPYTYLVLSLVLVFFVALCLKFTPFQEMSFERRIEVAERYNIPLDSAGNLTDGAGLNPQLVNYWFVIHPPNLYLGLVLFTVPFALALSALVSGELGDYWIRMTRRWAMVSWMFLTCGIVLGGLWAYRQLGWGGYWAWDPVENASFLPWCTATAFLHSVMIQERRDMLKWWNVFLVIATFFFTIEATYMTRSGEVASVHSFAGGEIGTWFRVFKLCLAGGGLLLLFLRYRSLRGKHYLESFFSRESAFFLNNLVLVAIALAVWCLSWLPKLSHNYLPGVRSLLFSVGLGNVAELLPDELTNQGSYNLVMTPFFALLLFLTAVGPGLGWVRTTTKSLVRNFLWPSVFALSVVCVVYLYLGLSGQIDSLREVIVPKFLARWWGTTDEAGDFYAVGLYPTGLFIFLSALIVGTVSTEFLRGLFSRVRHRKEDLISAFFRLVARDNRRYGGYTVHIGLALMAAGIVASSMFKIEKELTLRIGESTTVGPYRITPVEANRSYAELARAEMALRSGEETLDEIEPGQPYLIDTVLFRFTRPAGLPVAHGESKQGASAGEAPGPSETFDADRGEKIVVELRPERRFYPKQSGGQWINEVSIHRRLLGDIYVYYAARDEQNRVRLTVHLNPLMNLIWLGWFVMVFGGIFALLPIAGSKVGLSE